MDKVKVRKSSNTALKDKQTVSLSKNTDLKEIQQEVENEIYSSKLPGIYKYMQHNTCDTVRLNITLEEFKEYILIPNVYRPYFEAKENHCIIPCIFTELLGKTDKKLTNIIKQVGKVKYTQVLDSIPYIARNVSIKPSNLNKENLITLFTKLVVTSNLAILNEDRRLDIINKACDLCTCDYIHKSTANIIDIVGGIINSFTEEEVTALLEYNYPDMAPTIVLNTNKALNLEENIWLMLRSLMGYDIIVISQSGASIINFIRRDIINTLIVGKYGYNKKEREKEKGLGILDSITEYVSISTLIHTVVAIAIIIIALITLLNISHIILEENEKQLQSSIQDIEDTNSKENIDCIITSYCNDTLHTKYVTNILYNKMYITSDCNCTDDNKTIKVNKILQCSNSEHPKGDLQVTKHKDIIFILNKCDTKYEVDITGETDNIVLDKVLEPKSGLAILDLSKTDIINAEREFRDIPFEVIDTSKIRSLECSITFKINNAYVTDTNEKLKGE